MKFSIYFNNSATEYFKLMSIKEYCILNANSHGEYCTTELKIKNVCVGIEQKYTVLYRYIFHIGHVGTAQQNCVAERLNRTIIERARALLFDSGMINDFEIVERSINSSIFDKIEVQQKHYLHDKIHA